MRKRPSHKPTQQELLAEWEAHRSEGSSDLRKQLQDFAHLHSDITAVYAGCDPEEGFPVHYVLSDKPTYAAAQKTQAALLALEFKCSAETPPYRSSPHFSLWPDSKEPFMYRRLYFRQQHS